MKTRLKINSPTLKSRTDMLVCLANLRALAIRRAKLAAELDHRRKALDDAYAPQLDSISHEMDSLAEQLRVWAEANPSEFGGKKSIVTEHGEIGWRTGQPTLKTLPGWTWDRVLESLPGLEDGKYIRIKKDVNKQAILADREILGLDIIRLFGMRVVQDEPFFVEPNLTQPDNRLTPDSIQHRHD